MSGGLQGLKLEVKHIQKVFPKSHDFFRTVSASLDDLTFHFIQENGEKQVVSCNITVSCQAKLSIRILPDHLIYLLFQRECCSAENSGITTGWTWCTCP